jgi:hypothetical protein
MSSKPPKRLRNHSCLFATLQKLKDTFFLGRIHSNQFAALQNTNNMSFVGHEFKTVQALA